MTTHRFRRFITSATAQLAATYLAIIMFMCLGFSLVLYNTSSQQLSRQAPPHSLFSGQMQAQNQTQAQTEAGQQAPTTDGPEPQVTQFFQERLREGRHTLVIRLIDLNVAALLLGSLISYALARRSLEPIEQSMEAQAQFVSDASHELRTPLTAIQTSNEVFLRRSKLTITEAKRLIEQNTEDVKRLKVLSDGLLNLAQHKQTPIKTMPVQLQDIISDATTQIVPQATEKSIAFEDTIGTISVQADKATLTQALIIILDNAIKYSPSNTTVTVSSRVKGKHTYLDVADQGIGIRASDVPHLFRRFYRADSARTDSANNGYGLGLAIAKQIMINQQGDIDVISTLGKGSTFSLKIPTA